MIIIIEAYILSLLGSSLFSLDAYIIIFLNLSYSFLQIKTDNLGCVQNHFIKMEKCFENGCTEMALDTLRSGYDKPIVRLHVRESVCKKVSFSGKIKL